MHTCRQLQHREGVSPDAGEFSLGEGPTRAALVPGTAVAAGRRERSGRSELAIFGRARRRRPLGCVSCSDVADVRPAPRAPKARHSYQESLAILEESKPLIASALRKADARRADRLAGYLDGMRLRGLEQLYAYLDAAAK